MKHPGQRATAIGDDAKSLQPSAKWEWLMVRGILTFAIGTGAFFFPLAAVYGLAFVFAAVAFADGVISLAINVPRARRSHDPWRLLLFRGVIGILIGLGFVVTPALATMSYTLVALTILAAWAIMSGVHEISTALLLRKERSQEWLLAASGVVSILFGAVIVFVAVTYPAGFLVLAWVFAIYAMVSGLMVAGEALRRRRTG